MPNSRISVAECKKCGHVWQPRGDPAICAKCKRPFGTGNKVVRKLATAYLCSRCGHAWLARHGRGRPTACARCKYPTWDRPVA